jgi:hypothetical protein
MIATAIVLFTMAEAFSMMNQAWREDRGGQSAR